MAISFSGLASGLDTSSWVEALVSVKQADVSKIQNTLLKQQTTKSVLNDTRSTVSSLRTAIEKLTDAKFGGTFDLFERVSAQSSNADIFTATVTPGAKKQNYDISVEQLATCTKATSASPASYIADDSTKLTDLGIGVGSISTYVNGQKHSVLIGEEDTIGDLKAAFEGIGINFNVDENGVITLAAANEEDSLHIGATTDSSNFFSLLGLERDDNGVYTSSNAVYKASISSVLVNENAGFKEQIKAGTFTIGDETFTINENTTLSSVIAAINSSDKAQATAYWDDSTGKLTITSTKEGATYINIEAGTSNFTDVMGLTESEWDEDGALVSSRMFTGAQELGKNAILKINGANVISTSNTVTSDISRIDGVTLNLKRESTEEDGNTTLNVTQDTDGLVDALKTFVSAYNSFIEKIDTVTANGAELHGESSLTSLRSTIRNYANGANRTSGAYKLLSELGISTASADANNLNANTESLSLDENKLLAALAENPESVKSLLSGDNGILAMMENSIEQSLKAVSGFFDVKTSTIDSNIKKTEEKITKKNASISTYKAQLEKKFQAMENMIATMQQNYQSFSSGLISSSTTK